MATQVSLLSGAVASAGALSLQSNGTTEAIGISTGQVATLAQNPVLTSGTANGVAYLNGSKVLTTGSALTYDGNTFKNDTASTTAANIRIENGSFNRVGSFALTANGVQFDSFDQNSTSSQRAYMWLSGGSEQMRLTSGNLLVGTTSATGKLGVNGDGSQRIANFKNTAGTDATLFGIYVAKFQNDSSTSQRYIGFSYNNDNNGGGQINGNGASQAAFGSFSDIRLKENVVDLSPQLEKVLALRPVEFDYKTGGHQTGFIAQEMQQVFPDAVGDDGSENHYLTVTGWNKTEAILVKAIQEQQAIIETLKARLDAANL
jgi:hypothetical protein